MYHNNLLGSHDSSSWYADLKQYLVQGSLPEAMSAKQRRSMKHKVASYQMVQGNLFRNHHLDILLICLEYHEAQQVFKYLHDILAGGHYAGDTTNHKVMWVGLNWPTLFKDSHACVQKRLIFQKNAGRQARSSALLQPIAVEEPFQQWGLDVIGEIIPNLSKKHRYIFTTTNYFTRWVEEIPL